MFAPPMSGTNGWTKASVALAVLVLLGVLFADVPFVTRSPGPVFDVLGEVNSEPVLSLSGTESFPTTGQLDVTTVAERGGADSSLGVPAAVVGLFSRDSSVIPRELPDHEPFGEGREIEQRVFDASQSTALAAAADHVGRPVFTEPLVFAVVPAGPSADLLEPGDVIRRVDGRQVRRAAQVGAIIAPLPVGSEVVFAVERDGRDERIRVTTAESGETGGSVVGILVDNHYTSDFTVDISLQDIGGPSAGLVFALAIVDRLQRRDLLEGTHVAGTGTIAADGGVGPIGGIDKKMIAAADAGARLFLAPRDNCPDVTGATPSGLTVLPVDSLSDAVDGVADWLANRDLPACGASDGDSRTS